jgi:hypothetical protein
MYFIKIHPIIYSSIEGLAAIWFGGQHLAASRNGRGIVLKYFKMR